MRRVLPLEPSDRDTEITVDDAYAAFLGSHERRPWVGACMVSSIDGSTVVDGASGGLSSRNDSAILSQLRRIADVIIVGAGTARSEGYGPPRKDGQRIGLVTTSARLDYGTPLFTSGAGFVITTTTATVPDSVDRVRAGTGTVDLSVALANLHTVCERSRYVQCEGGPSLNGAMLDADLIDEINVTTSPMLVGGAGPRLTNGAGAHTTRFTLAQLVADDESYLYGRWLRQR